LKSDLTKQAKKMCLACPPRTAKKPDDPSITDAAQMVLFDTINEFLVANRVQINTPLRRNALSKRLYDLYFDVVFIHY